MSTAGVSSISRPVVCQWSGALRPGAPGTSPRQPDQKCRGTRMGAGFGTQEPFPGEIASRFADRVLVHSDAKPGTNSAAGAAASASLKSKKCLACEGGDTKPLTPSETDVLLRQCPGWKVTINNKGIACITHDWKVRNFMTGLELFKRIAAVAEAEGHHPDLHLVGYNRVTAELSTHSIGGLTENDFIMAAKIGDLELADLLPKRKPKA